jgi:hypothetical protein
MQNKPNFENDKMNITLDMTSIYEILSAGSGQKTNPIQTQFKPKQTQLKPIQSQFKPNCQKGKNERFCAEKEFKMVYSVLLANFITLKDANFKKGFRYIPKLFQAPLRPRKLLLSTRFGILI